MPDDPILDEIHRFREEHAAKFDNDVDAIVRDLQTQELKEKRPLVVLAPRPPVEIAGRTARGSVSAT
jgi:predicted metallo-beta-lactamase superfamily hydrolase